MDGNGEVSIDAEQILSVAGCGDDNPPLELDTVDDVMSDDAKGQGDAKAETEQEQVNNTTSNNNKNKAVRGQKRRQKNNVHRVQGVAIPSLFPVPLVQDNFDLRNVLSGQGAGDVGPWWHRPPHQHTFQQANHQPNYQQTKKPRTETVWKKKPNQNSQGEKQEDPIEDILNPLKYVVVPSDYPQTLLTDQQFELLQALLLDSILKMEDDEPVPRFWRAYMRHGALLLYVADEKSIEWLVDTVPALALEDVRLRTGPAKDIILTRKFTTFVPKLLKDFDDGMVLKLLKSQNPALKCNLWQIVSCVGDDKGRNMTLAVDEESYKVIRANMFKAHLGLGIIKFNNSQQYNVVYASANTSSAAATNAPANATTEPTTNATTNTSTNASTNATTNATSN